MTKGMKWKTLALLTIGYLCIFVKIFDWFLKKSNEFKGTCSLCSMFENIFYQWCDNFCILFISLKDSGLICNQFHFINIRYILLSVLDSSLLAYCQDQYMSVHLNSGENMPAQAPQWTEFLSCQVRLPNLWFLQHSQIQRFCKTKISFKKIYVHDN